MRQSRGMIYGMALTLALTLGACDNVGLRELKSNSAGPDEFLVQPVKPLEQPGDYAALPPPTPGGSNLADQNPLDDAIVALGGRPRSAGAVPARDGAMVNYVSRFGVSADIRQSLAAEDAEFRRKRSRFTQYRIFPVDYYNEVYEPFAIDPGRVSAAFRRAGVNTPSSPP